MDLTNDRVIDDVRAELASDPRLPYPDEIAVESFGDAVTLRGTVGSFRPAARGLRRRAAHARRRRRVRRSGCAHPRPRPPRGRGDPGAALQRLSWGSEIPGDHLDIYVEDGWVTLKGDVDYQFQSDLAFDDVSRLYGVTGVTNDIKVVERL